MFLWRLPACKVALQPTKSGSQPEVKRPLTPLSFDFGDWQTIQNAKPGKYL